MITHTITPEAMTSKIRNLLASGQLTMPLPVPLHAPLPWGCDNPQVVTFGTDYAARIEWRPVMWDSILKQRSRWWHNGRWWEDIYVPPCAWEPVKLPPSAFNYINQMFYLSQEVPCRKCAACLRRKRSKWHARARQEIAMAPRTWLVTLTYAAAHRLRVRVDARCRFGNETFTALQKQVSLDITKYFKRLRKDGHRFRYLVAVEPHKDGFPHSHVLMHEVAAPVTYRSIGQHWPWGFFDAKLVEDGPVAARYVTKYLTKQQEGSRVRASLRYGHGLCHTDPTVGGLSGDILTPAPIKN